MKKLFAFLLSLVLVFTLVAVVACDNSNEPGGGSFKEVDLTDKDTREEFVNALAEKVDIEKLVGDPTKEGWSYGLEETDDVKLAFDNLTLAMGAQEYSVDGSVELNESAKVSIKTNGKNETPDLAASLSLSAKGNVELSDSIYDLIDTFSDEFASMLGYGYYNLPALVKDVITNFDYSVEAYADNEVALIKLSEGLYNKIPDVVTDLLGSNLIKIAFGGSASTYAASTESGLPTLDEEDVKEVINEVIDEFILPFKISVAVATKNGYALRLTVSSESILAILDEALEGAPAWTQKFKSAIDSSTKLELTVRVDEEGSFNSIALESNVKLALDVNIEGTTIKGSVSLSSSVELKKFSGTVSKPSNASEYKELEF